MSTDIFMLDVLLNRIETHPEEFGASGKWVRIIGHYEDCLTEEEKKKITESLYKARRARFNEALMKALAGEDESSTEVVPIKEAYTFNSKNRLQTFSNTTNEHIKIHAEAKAELVKEIQRLKEEQEMKAMHDYYRLKGQAE